MSFLGSLVGLGVWLAIGLAGYSAVSLVILFYVPNVEKLSSGAVADVTFAVTLPFLLAMVWLASIRK